MFETQARRAFLYAACALTCAPAAFGQVDRSGTLTEFVETEGVFDYYQTTSGREASQFLVEDDAFSIDSSLFVRKSTFARVNGTTVATGPDGDPPRSTATFELGLDGGYRFDLSGSSDYTGTDIARTRVRIDRVGSAGDLDRVLDYETIFNPGGAFSTLDQEDGLSASGDPRQLAASGVLTPGVYRFTHAADTFPDPLQDIDQVGSTFRIEAVSISGPDGPAAVPTPSALAAGLTGLMVLTRRRRR